MMKKAIWISFVTLALIWTGFAFLAAGLARWTSDAIASDRMAETTLYVAHASERVSQKLTDATGRVTEQVTATMAQTLGEKEQAVDGSTGTAPAPGAPSAPILPPLPDWVDQWLAPEMVQSIKAWGAWAKSVANDGKAAVTDAANSTAQAAKAAETSTLSDLLPAETNRATDSSDKPWLAVVIGWLVPIVWVIWAIGLIVGLLLTLIAQWGLSRFLGSSLLKSTSAT